MRKQQFRFLLACLLLMPMVLPLARAQTSGAQTAQDIVNAVKLSAARDSDTQNGRFQHRPNSGAWQAHGTMRHQASDGHHAAIGALIGFGIGAAVGVAFNQDQHTRARVAAPILFGAFGALIGAAVTGSHRWMYSRVHRQPGRDEDEYASSGKPVGTQGSAEMKPDSLRSTSGSDITHPDSSEKKLK